MDKKLYEGLLLSNFDTVKAAIAAGADINEPHGKTPALHLALHMPEALALFLKLGVDPVGVNSTGGSAAPQRGRFLVSFGSDAGILRSRVQRSLGGLMRRPSAAHGSAG